MLDRVAIDKIKIYELIRRKEYEEAGFYIDNVRKVIELAAKKRVNKYIEENIIFKDEEELFFKIIENNINNKLIKDNGFVLMNENDVEIMKERLAKFKSITNKKKK